MQSIGKPVTPVGAFLVGCAAVGYLVLRGTTSPSQSLVVLGMVPVAGLLATWTAIRSDRTYLACASFLLAVLGIPLALGLVYLRSGV